MKNYIEHELRPNIWIKFQGRYWFFKGFAPNGSPRIRLLDYPPYGKTVYLFDGRRLTGTEKIPFRMRWPAITLASLTLLFAVLAILTRVGGGFLAPFVLTVLTLAFGLATYLTHTGAMQHNDDVDLAEAEAARAEMEPERNRLRQEDQARHAQAAAMNAQQAQRAMWAQMAAIHHQLDPNVDIWRPYGQSPPM